MKAVKNIFEYESSLPSVVTIGKFDGIHLGHRELVRSVKTFADTCGREVNTVLFSFDMAQVYLLTHKERRKLLEREGIRTVVECPFTPEIITMEAEDFIRKILADRLHAVHVVVGPDFHFGYGRRGDAHLLEQMGEELGFSVEVVPEVEYENEKISSTRIRNCVSEGNMEDASGMLGYPYFVTGQVIHGRHLGRTIGVPTANMIPGKKKLLPPNGVYCTISKIGDKKYPGITNIGTKPTVDGQFIGVETYLFSFDGDVYGETEEVRLLHFVRPEKKFDSLELLREQISQDHAVGEAYFRDNGIL